MEGWSVSATAGRQAGAGAREQQRRAAATLPAWQRALRRVFDIHDDERAWRRGAEGEELVGRLLGRLGPAWVVLHDLRLAATGANLDHLVIGPPGVFTINTKNLTGSVWVGERVVMRNGHRTDYLRTARWEARTTRQLLHRALGTTGDVTPALAILCDRFTVRQQPQDVTVLKAEHLVPWLWTHQPALYPSTVMAIAAAARRPTTWPALAPDRTDRP